MLNLFRAGVFLTAGAAGAAHHLDRTGTVAAPVFVVLAWGLAAVVLNFTVFSRAFPLNLAWLLATLDIVVVAVVNAGMHGWAESALGPGEPDQLLERSGLILLVVGSTAMLRFSWKLSVWSMFLVIGAYCALVGLYGRIDGGNGIAIVFMVCMGSLLVYATHRFEKITTRIIVDTRQAQEERLAATRSLVAGVAHEMNTPLGALSANAQITDRAVGLVAEAIESDAGAQLRSSNPRVSKAVEALRSVRTGTADATARLRDVVRGLSEFARIDAADVREVDLNESLDSVLAISSSSKLADVHVVKEYGDLPLHACRPAHINQVLFHVLRNAAEASDEGSRIWVRTWSDADSIVVEVEDQGCGMAPETLRSLFDPRFTNTKGRSKMGFGLLGSLGIVRDHGGELDVKSELGVGTTVRVVLPRSHGVEPT